MKSVIIYFSYVLFSTVTLISCSDDNVVNTPSPVVDRSDFRYPFTDGSSWEYTRTLYASDIRPDSILHYFTDYPIVLTGRATILYDTVINSILTKCFLDEFVVNNISRSNRYYYINSIMDEDKQEEIYEYFKESETDSIIEALKELGEEDYTEEEIRLIRIKFIAEYGH